MMRGDLSQSTCNEGEEDLLKSRITVAQEKVNIGKFSRLLLSISVPDASYDCVRYLEILSSLPLLCRIDYV